ncbi:hypothetical protein L6452_42343 [Arctium lappa]|uniref:Uncharacterized protein n=1 Tax=Arctium lappa TaxID=4217 RepID=A0ACB8XM27_ARCLA|nr:hypothetical protein L6452_42343 [Arctium lappa]
MKSLIFLQFNEVGPHPLPRASLSISSIKNNQRKQTPSLRDCDTLSAYHNKIVSFLSSHNLKTFFSRIRWLISLDYLKKDVAYELRFSPES